MTRRGLCGHGGKLGGWFCWCRQDRPRGKKEKRLAQKLRRRREDRAWKREQP